MIVGEGVASGNWQAIWNALPSLPFEDALRASLALREAPWRPSGDAQAREFAEIVGLASLTSGTAWSEAVRLPGLLATPPRRFPVAGGALVPSPAAPAVSFVPDGRDGVWTWDLVSGAERGHWNDLPSRVRQVAYADDGSLYALLAADWTGSHNELVGGRADRQPVTLQPLPGRVAKFAPVDEEHVLTVSDDVVLTLWRVLALDAPSPTEALSRVRLMRRPHRVLVTSDMLANGAWAFVQSDAVTVFDAHTLRALWQLDSPGARAITATSGAAAGTDAENTAPFCRAVLFGDGTGDVHVLTFRARGVGHPRAENTRFAEPEPARPSLRQVRTSPDGHAVVGLEWLDEQTAAVVWKDGHVELLDWPSGDTLEALDTRLDAITAVAPCRAGDGFTLCDCTGACVWVDMRFRRGGGRLAALLDKSADSCTSREWARLRSALEGGGLPETNAGALRFVHALLARRFAHAIGVRAAREPRFGEHDIAIRREGG